MFAAFLLVKDWTVIEAIMLSALSEFCNLDEMGQLYVTDLQPHCRRETVETPQQCGYCVGRPDVPWAATCLIIVSPCSLRLAQAVAGNMKLARPIYLWLTHEPAIPSRYLYPCIPLRSYVVLPQTPERSFKNRGRVSLESRFVPSIFTR